MDINELTKLCDKLGCRITLEAALKEYITFRFGGPCRALININSAASAAELIKYMKQELIYQPMCLVKLHIDMLQLMGNIGQLYQI